jgi:CRISPR-associated protein Csb2
MERVLLISVRFHDGRYHGTGDWPPSPARLFQALVAGVGQEGPLGDDVTRALEWLEELDPPVIAFPTAVDGVAVTNFVPNNDLDAMGGDPRRISAIRAAKPWKPKLFDREAALHYAWRFGDAGGTSPHAERVCGYAERLYQLGRGIDQAWATGEIIELPQLEDLLAAYRGVVHRPTGGAQGTILQCPQKGSLESLKVRHAAMGQRFRAQGQSRAITLQFAQAPKPRFRPACYDSPPSTQVLDLCSLADQGGVVSWPLSRIGELVVAIRNGATEKLKTASPEQEAEIEKCLVGRKADGEDAAPKSARVRILPLPSIGHVHVDHAIRRVLIEVPAGCLVRAADVFWAFSGLELNGPDPASQQRLLLTTTNNDAMLRHYGADGTTSARWRTVTPAALPESAKRRRIEPTRRREEAKRGAERRSEQEQAAGAVVQALRHAEVQGRPTSIRVQREPFEANGERVEAFAPRTRFPKERLWHVEISFEEPISGPLVVGDGRYYGLGLMAPVAGS